MKKLERYLSILHQVADETEINAEQIVSACKREDVADARALLINLLYEEGFYPIQISGLSGICPRCVNTYISQFKDRVDSKRMLGIYYENVRRKLRVPKEDTPS